MLRILLRALTTSVLLLPGACDRNESPSTPRDRADRSSPPEVSSPGSGPEFEYGPSLASQAPEVAPAAVMTDTPTATPAAPAPDPANAASPPTGTPNTAPAAQPNTQPAAPQAPRTQGDPISEMDQPRGNSISEMDSPRGNSISEMQGEDPITHEPQRQQ